MEEKLSTYKISGQTNSLLTSHYNVLNTFELGSLLRSLIEEKSTSFQLPYKASISGKVLSIPCEILDQHHCSHSF